MRVEDIAEGQKGAFQGNGHVLYLDRICITQDNPSVRTHQMIFPTLLHFTVNLSQKNFKGKLAIH